MIYLAREDFYEVHLGSMLSSYDREILTLLYQPFISSDALSLYFTLWSEQNRQDIFELETHDRLIKTLGISVNDFVEARKKLEATGLIQTFIRKKDDINYYIYLLFAPKTPKEFFKDILFKGLLTKAIGEKETYRLMSYFASKEVNLEGYQEISATFPFVFSLEYDSNIFKNSGNSIRLRGRKIKSIDQGFDFAIFYKNLFDNHQILQSSFTKEDSKEISRLSLLFGLDELQMSEFVSQIYNFEDEKHLDHEKLYNLAVKANQFGIIRNTHESNIQYPDENEFGKYANLVSNIPPFEFLKLKQGYTNPAPSDVRLINQLSSEMNLEFGVINVLIDYVLRKYNNQLSKELVLKIAGSLKRSKIETAYDAISYFYRSNKRNDKKPAKKYKKNVSSHEVLDENFDVEKIDMNEEEFLEALKEISQWNK